MNTDLYLVLFTIFIAILFDLINGFHDAANSIATVVSTQVLKPQIAVFWAAFFNFVAIFILTPRVAESISEIVKIQSNESVYIWVIFSGLIGAILWDLLTWWLSLPVSSSHALIGGVAGAGIAYGGFEALHAEIILTTVAFIVISPLLGFCLGFVIMLTNYLIVRFKDPTTIDRFFRKSQLASAALYSIGHGANDAQKTMGIILAVLIASGFLPLNTKISLFHEETWWIVLTCNFAMSVGTALGGWRIVKTMGMRLTKLKPMGGFSAETAGAISIFFATHFGIPVSTTHTITASIMGVGVVSNPLSKIKWLVATRIVWAWILTLPAAGAMGALIFYLIKTQLAIVGS